MEQMLLPTSACDCHMHIFNSRFPVIRQASLRPPDASLEDYRVVQDKLGLSRFVVVQPSIYGLDNSLLLETLAAAGPERARGVAVVTDMTPDEELHRLMSLGVRGVRFNQVQNGVTSWTMLPELAPRLAAHDLHIQLHCVPDSLIAQEQKLARLKNPLVIDHIGRVASMPNIRHSVEEALRRLLDSGRVWIKLSAPYLASENHDAFDDIAMFVESLIQTYPDRLLWGSDWPHATESNKPCDKKMISFFHSMMNKEVLQKVFVANPASLYGFSA